MVNVYKEISISLLSSLKKKSSKDPIVIGITTSNESTNTAFLARQLLDYYESNDIKTILINAVVDGNELIIPSEIAESELSFAFSKEKITYSAGKELVDGLKEHYKIIIIALDKLTTSIPSLIFASCCDGVVLFEAKEVSSTLEIDQLIKSLKNIDVKPLGFVLG